MLKGENEMEIWNKIVALIMVLFGMTGSIPAQSQSEIPENAETYDITAMTYNVYISGAGKKSPENRSAGVINNLRNVMPDVFGLQEADYDWIQRISAGMPEYSFVGVGRNDGANDGEFSPLFYNSEKYGIVSSGTFWFSDTPDTPSVTWAGMYKRICSWAVLEDKETGFVFASFNSHWDHLSVTSRNKSAELLLAKIEEYAPDMPVVIMGDFNCKAETVAYETLINGGFVDSRYVSAVTDSSITYHGYNSLTVDDKIIDHILFKNVYGYANSYKVVTDKYDGIYSSAHFPVVSQITLYK